MIQVVQIVFLKKDIVGTLTVIASNISKLRIVGNKEWCGGWIPLKGVPMINDPKGSSQWVKSLKVPQSKTRGVSIQVP